MNPLDKIHLLDDIEKDIVLCMQSAGQALQELGKEKSSQKNAETQTQQFLKSLANVENKLSEQITYLAQVSTGQAHEGSGYASAKVLQMAWHRIQHARSRVRELEETKAKHSYESRQQQKRQREQGAAFAQQQQAQQAAAAATASQPQSGGSVSSTPESSAASSAPGMAGNVVQGSGANLSAPSLSSDNSQAMGGGTPSN